MKEGFIIRDQSAPHFITATVVDWIDIFTRKIYKDYVIDSLDYSIRNKGLIVFAYVIMSNHIHLIIQAKDNNLSDVIRDFKKFTAKTILREIETSNESRKGWMLERFIKATKTHSRNKKYQFWQYGNHPEEIYTEKFLWSKINYIHLNPVRAGVVENAADYLYSSASNYMGGRGVLTNIEIAANPVVDVLKPSSFDNYLRM
ncbi:transposase [Aequorivita sp. H23M31]|uniref:Transposase n=1 Tax=Aequorivita ciconiae TaxID=2494375 RepID=A0A410G631_9FLAO|nr:transposase [Aequorivita sp. H23M31]QAA82700.1 transposase [Aequorivita sp. H23M31]